ncbi:MAG TPA: GtrA family protein [Candidatus Moranbacteria bacterium]|nr:GtrA family protein [Candidatus Moranbacteria bacterium]
MSKKDYSLSFIAGLFIGLLFLPVLYAAKPELYAKFSLFIIPFFIIAVPFGLAIAHLISRKITVVWQIGKFGVTGVLNVLVDMGVLSIMTFMFRAYFSIDSKTAIFGALSFLTFYSIFKSISFIVANINSYLWNKYWTFNQEGGKKTEFVQFFIVSVVGFVINVLVASLVFKSISGFSADQAGLIGAAMGSIAGLVWNFLGYKFIVFKK